MGKQRVNTRKEMYRVLSGLDQRWIKAASHELCSHLGSLIEAEYGDRIQHVLAWSVFFQGEADLSQFISEQLEGRTVYLPRSLSDYSMTFISVGRDWSDNSERGIYGIPEPGGESGQQYMNAMAYRTAIIVPGLAFDKSGNRIGRGKGYYDRFLGAAGMQEAVKIGVGWSLQIIDQIAPESHDVPMDWICHERGVIKVS